MDNDASTEHIVRLPTFITWIRIIQAAISVTVLGLAAGGLALLPEWDSVNSTLGYNIFVCVYTIVILYYFIFVPKCQPSLYNRWIMLGFEISGVIFWLVGFATMAAWASTWAAAAAAANVAASDYATYGEIGSFYDLTGLGFDALGEVDDDLINNFYTGWQLDTAGSGVGAIGFVLFVITFIIFSQHLQRHRTSGAPAMALQPVHQAQQPADPDRAGGLLPPMAER